MTIEDARGKDERVEDIVDWLLDQGDHCEGPPVRAMRGAIVAAYKRGESARPEGGEIVAFLKEAKRGHYYCEDCWYSCPKAPEGCCDDQKPKNVCDCGADEWNAKVDAMILKLSPPQGER